MDRADIAIRLVEERARAGYSAADFARKLDISREGLRLYENGQRGIPAELLAAAVLLGVDAQYVLTGVKSKNQDAVEKAVSPVVSMKGNAKSNVVQFAQSGSNINLVTTDRHVTTTRAEVRPGEDHISESEARLLTDLVRDVIEHEQKLKARPATRAAVWSALNAHCGVTRYRLIKSDDFEKARKYLHVWIGRLNSMPSAFIKDGDAVRKRRYAYIKINTKGDDAWLTGYLEKNFRAKSITEIDDRQLDKVYQAVARRKRKSR